MALLSTGYDSVGSIAQLITVTLIFIFVLFLTYWTTRVAGGYKKQQMKGNNIHIVETVVIGNGKYVQIIKVGSKYLAIVVCKDTVTKLCELTEDEIDIVQNTEIKDSFEIILEKIKKKRSGD